MAELSEIFEQLDEDIRELLTLVHMVKINMMTESDSTEQLSKALLLAQKIEAELYKLKS